MEDRTRRGSLAPVGELGQAPEVPAGYIDLHCHWVSGIDDGARSTEDSREILEGLAKLGFTRVLATPHMRPGMFDNTVEDLKRAYEACVAALGSDAHVVQIGLSCEHYLDDVVLGRLLSGAGCLYPGGKAALIECATGDISPWLGNPIRQLQRIEVRPILAHPERLPSLWRDPARLAELIELGAAALLDIATLVGAYGRRPMECARRLLELDLYDAACSDAHHPRDLAQVSAGLAELRASFGAQSVDALLIRGPLQLLDDSPR